MLKLIAYFMVGAVAVILFIHLLPFLLMGVVIAVLAFVAYWVGKVIIDKMCENRL